MDAALKQGLIAWVVQTGLWYFILVPGIFYGQTRNVQLLLSFGMPAALAGLTYRNMRKQVKSVGAAQSKLAAEIKPLLAIVQKGPTEPGYAAAMKKLKNTRGVRINYAGQVYV